MNSFAEHPLLTLLIMFTLLMLFVSNHQLKQTSGDAFEWMVVAIVCFICSYCFWNLFIHSPFTHQPPFIRSIDARHPFIQWNSFNGLWCGVGDVGGVGGGVQDAMEPNEVMSGVVVGDVVSDALVEPFDGCWSECELRSG